jgi:hypothetical protein
MGAGGEIRVHHIQPDGTSAGAGSYNSETASVVQTEASLGPAFDAEMSNRLQLGVIERSSFYGDSFAVSPRRRMPLCSTQLGK